MLIKSSENEKFKYFKKILNKKNRYEENLFFVEGLVVLNEALDKFMPKYVAVKESKIEDKSFKDFLGKIEDKKIFVFKDNLFNRLTDSKSPQGIIGYFEMIHKNFNKKHGKYIYIDDLQEPGNLGGIIRSADAFNLDGVILSKNTVDIYNPKTIRSSMASIFRVPIYFLEDDLFNIGFSIVATALKNSTKLSEYKFLEDEIYVIGNEARGVSSYILENADVCLNIPIRNEVNSLNANVAASILMYELKLLWNIL